MLTCWGSSNRFCDGVSRRDFLRVGGLGLAGLSLPGLLQARPAGPAKRCILLFMNGGPPQMDLFDLKPEAPAEVRGELKPISTDVPGVQISERFPLLSRHMGKCAIIRSVTDEYVGGAHGQSVYLALTGHRGPRIQGDDIKPAPDDYPNIGGAVARLLPARKPVPSHVWLLDMHRRTFAGEGGGFLGAACDPFRILKDPNRPNFQVEALTPPKEIPAERIGERRQLLDEINRQADELMRRGQPAALSAHYQRALNLVASADTQKAFNLAAEPAATRDRYGRHKFGQGVLLARRLVEHGVPLVTVCWSGDEVSQGWDLHYNSYKNLKVLMPPLDAAFSALLEDLAERGMLDDTLVVWMGEFGRAPRIEDKGGRGHWGKCYSVVFAGGGVRGGMVYGRSDRHAATPAENPVDPSDIVTTIYHLLGIDTETVLVDALGRPLRLCLGQPVHGILA